MSENHYIPALRFRVLTSVYDPLIRLTTRETAFKGRLLKQALAEPRGRILDLACGTGTLAIAAKQASPEAEVVGLDGDPEILERARTKAATAGVEVDFEEGRSTELPYPADSFDLVVCTLFFHHLTLSAKRQSAREIARVLRPGGELWMADWGRPQDPLMALAILVVRLLDGFEPTRENVAGALPSIFAEAGLGDARETERLRTPLGTVSLYRATGPER